MTIYVLQDVCPGCPENEIGPHTFVNSDLTMSEMQELARFKQMEIVCLTSVKHWVHYTKPLELWEFIHPHQLFVYAHEQHRFEFEYPLSPGQTVAGPLCMNFSPGMMALSTAALSKCLEKWREKYEAPVDEAAMTREEIRDCHYMRQFFPVISEEIEARKVVWLRMPRPL